MTIKIGRYVINNNYDTCDEIDALEWQLDEKDCAVIKWAWPQNTTIRLAIVFTLMPDDYRGLEDLIRDNDVFVIVTKDIDRYFSQPISEVGGTLYKVFPGKFGQNDEIILINQTRSNVSEILYKKVKVSYKITYNKLMFSKYRKSSIEIFCSEGFDLGRALYYTVTRKKLRYPLNDLSKSNVLYVAQDEEIAVNVFEAYQNTVELVEKD